MMDHTLGLIIRHTNRHEEDIDAEEDDAKKL
jgi:hypothetical protein